MRFSHQAAPREQRDTLKAVPLFKGLPAPMCLRISFPGRGAAFCPLFPDQPSWWPWSVSFKSHSPHQSGHWIQAKLVVGHLSVWSSNVTMDLLPHLYLPDSAGPEDTGKKQDTCQGRIVEKSPFYDMLDEKTPTLCGYPATLQPP